MNYSFYEMFVEKYIYKYILVYRQLPTNLEFLFPLPRSFKMNVHQICYAYSIQYIYVVTWSQVCWVFSKVQYWSKCRILNHVCLYYISSIVWIYFVPLSSLFIHFLFLHNLVFFYYLPNVQPSSSRMAELIAGFKPSWSCLI